MVDFEFAKDKVLMGSERRSMIISDEEKRVTAIHEAGHALLAVLLPHADPVHKVTIIPRGMALGLTQQLPIDDKHNYSREYLERPDRDPARRPHRRGDHVQQHDDRRRQRPRARHRDGAQDGLRVGHERRDGPADLRQEGRADLPRPRDRAAPGLQRGHGDQDRPGGQALRHRQLRARQAAHRAAQGSARPDGRRAARARGARRRAGPAHGRRASRSRSCSVAAASSTPSPRRLEAAQKERPSIVRRCRRSTSRWRRNRQSAVGIDQSAATRRPDDSPSRSADSDCRRDSPQTLLAPAARSAVRSPSGAHAGHGHPQRHARLVRRWRATVRPGARDCRRRCR